MANLIFDKAQIEATIDKIVDRTMRMDMTWDWPCGVAYYGICEAYEVTKNERYLQLVKDRVDEYIELGLPSWTVNTCSMGHCLITLYEHTGDEKYLDIAKSKVEYLEKEALRFGDHVLQHHRLGQQRLPRAGVGGYALYGGLLPAADGRAFEGRGPDR